MEEKQTNREEEMKDVKTWREKRLRIFNNKFINLIKALFSHIQDDFHKMNKPYSRPTGFNAWYVDK